MFTGIVTASGTIERLEPVDEGLKIAIGPTSGQIDLAGCDSGDSIAVSGVCLTMLDPADNGFTADVSAETLALTTLGQRRQGDTVNLELALRAGDRLGGHLVSGHVDSTVPLLSRRPDGESERFQFGLPEDLAHLVCRKGSVTLDGVSLTVNSVAGDRFSVCIIPHTLAVTTLGALEVGDRVNIEVDMIARYLARLAERQ